jgi:pyruvate ferredoxin oxidoreductase gamma subunit
MYRIRLHGRGGQGMKTAGRIVGSAFFTEGYEVQDAPRYGAERRGAPIFATVRASKRPIHERGAIRRPDLVVVADATLIPVAAASVLAGLDERSALLIESDVAPEVWRERLRLAGPVFTLPAEAGDRDGSRFVGARCAAAVARMVGVVSRASLVSALRDELEPLGERVVAENLERALRIWEQLASRSGCVSEGPEDATLAHERPDWIDLPFDPASVSAPDVFGAATSVQVRTGLWRTMRPVIDREICRGCTWVCSTFCPDAAIGVDATGAPQIDYDHCKGCLVCVAVCPPHAIRAVPERDAAGEQTAGEAR